MDILPIQKDDEKTEQTIPYNLEAEQSLLGALLLNNQVYEKVSDFLKADHFSHDIHGQIYHAIVTLIDSGKIADPITLKAYFAQSDALKDVGGAAYLVSKAIVGAKVVAFDDLGMEAIYEFAVKDMPVTVAVDASGESVHQTGPQIWKAKIEEGLLRIQ